MTWFKKIGLVVFPEMTGIRINMMPFIMGERDSIPSEYLHYLPLLTACPLPPSELGKVGYLTIHESIVEPNTSQRRKGVHTEKHPTVAWGGGSWGGGNGDNGGGNSNNKGHGLYMASTVENSTKVWNAGIIDPGVGGDCEHLKEVLGEGTVLQANELAWMTDATPHESLPIPVQTKRQFFRLVTSNVSLWYEQHSTKNRLGVQPQCKVLTHNKF